MIDGVYFTLTAKVLSPTLEVMRPSIAPCSVSNSCSLCRRPWWNRLQARTDTRESRARTTTGPSMKRTKVSTWYQTGSPSGADERRYKIITFHKPDLENVTWYPPLGSSTISELAVVLLLHISWEQQKMAYWKEEGLEHCIRILSESIMQPRSNTIPLPTTFMDEKHCVPWHWVAWWHLSHRQDNCPSVKDTWRQHTNGFAFLRLLFLLAVLTGWVANVYHGKTMKCEEKWAEYLNPQLMSAGPAARAAEGRAHGSDPCLSALQQGRAAWTLLQTE